MVIINHKGQNLKISYDTDILYFKNSKKEKYRKIYNIKINNEVVNLENDKELIEKIIQNVKINGTQFLKTKNQHFVPQFIQREWAINKSISKKNQKVETVYYNECALPVFSKNKIEKNFTSDYTFNHCENNTIYYFEEGVLRVIEDAILEIKTNYNTNGIIKEDLNFILSYALMERNQFKSFLIQSFAENDNDLTLKEFSNYIKLYYFKNYFEIKNQYQFTLFESKIDIFPLYEDWVIPFYSSDNFWSIGDYKTVDLLIVPLQPNLFILLNKKNLSTHFLKENLQLFGEQEILSSMALILCQNTLDNNNKKMVLTPSNKNCFTKNKINIEESLYKNEIFLHQIENKTTNKDKIIDHFNEAINYGRNCATLDVVRNINADFDAEDFDDYGYGSEMFADEHHFYIGAKGIYLIEKEDGKFKEVKSNINGAFRANLLLQFEYKGIKKLDFTRKIYDKPVVEYDFNIKGCKYPPVTNYIIKEFNDLNQCVREIKYEDICFLEKG